MIKDLPKLPARKDNPIKLSLPMTVITHNDLDGIGCATLLIKCFPEIQTQLVNAGDETIRKITAIINEALNNKNMDIDIYISDLNINCNNIGKNFLNAVEAYNTKKSKNIHYFDHHLGSLWLKDKSWATVNTSRCAAYILWDAMSSSFNLKEMEHFAVEVDKYDRWLKERNIGTAWTLLIKKLGPQHFLDRAKKTFTHSYEKLTEKESSIINSLFIQKKIYIKKAMKRIKFSDEYFDDINSAVSVATVHADNHVSEIGNLILDTLPDIEVAYVINHDEGNVYMITRGNVKIIDLAISRGGGGHSRVAGFPVSFYK